MTTTTEKKEVPPTTTEKKEVPPTTTEKKEVIQIVEDRLAIKSDDSGLTKIIKLFGSVLLHPKVVDDLIAFFSVLTTTEKKEVPPTTTEKKEVPPTPSPGIIYPVEPKIGPTTTEKKEVPPTTTTEKKEFAVTERFLLCAERLRNLTYFLFLSTSDEYYLDVVGLTESRIGRCGSITNAYGCLNVSQILEYLEKLADVIPIWAEAPDWKPETSGNTFTTLEWKSNTPKRLRCLRKVDSTTGKELIMTIEDLDQITKDAVKAIVCELVEREKKIDHLVKRQGNLGIMLSAGVMGMAQRHKLEAYRINGIIPTTPETIALLKAQNAKYGNDESVRKEINLVEYG